MPNVWTKLADIVSSRSQAAKRQVKAFPRPNGERHLLVDVSVVYQKDARTGIQRVVRGLLLQFLAMRLDGYVVRPVFATPGHSYRYASVEGSPSDGLHFDFEDGAIDVQSGDIFLGLDLAAHILPAHRATIRRWRASGAHIAIVIYDLLPVLRPSWFNDRMVWHFRRWLRVVADYADSVLCISAHVAENFRDWIATQHAFDARRIVVHHVPLGHDLVATLPSLGMPDDGEALLAAISAVPTMLMVGTVEPRKAYEVSLAAFERLWEQVPDTPYNLVVVGKPGWKTTDLQARMRKHAMNGTRLFWFEDASDQFLDRLYEACSAVMVTSYTEGFGLPIVEAQGYGKPVLVRDIPVFREIGQGNIVYFQDDAALPLSLAIAGILNGKHPGSAVKEHVAQAMMWRDASVAWLAALGISAIRASGAADIDEVASASHNGTVAH